MNIGRVERLRGRNREDGTLGDGDETARETEAPREDGGSQEKANAQAAASGRGDAAQEDGAPPGPFDGEAASRETALVGAVLRIGASLDLDTVLREVVESARALTGADYGVIATVDENRLPLRRRPRARTRRQPEADGTVKQAIREGPGRGGEVRRRPRPDTGARQAARRPRTKRSGRALSPSGRSHAPAAALRDPAVTPAGNRRLRCREFGSSPAGPVQAQPACAAAGGAAAPAQPPWRRCSIPRATSSL